MYSSSDYTGLSLPLTKKRKSFHGQFFSLSLCQHQLNCVISLLMQIQHPICEITLVSNSICLS